MMIRVMKCAYVTDYRRREVLHFQIIQMWSFYKIAQSYPSLKEYGKLKYLMHHALTLLSGVLV